jgi:hypothetical protein
VPLTSSAERVRVVDHRVERVADAQRAAATIVWEDSDRPPRTLYYSNAQPAADWLETVADTFAAAALPLAVWSGERRLYVQGTLCPRLHDGLRAMSALFQAWEPHRVAVTIDAAAGNRARTRRPDRRSLLFLSGGVDSLALLHANRTAYAHDHSLSFRDALLLFGLNNFDFDGDDARPERLVAFRAQETRLRALGDATGLELLSVQTNVRTLYPDYDTWVRFGWTMGAFSSALLFARRITEAWISGDGSGPLPEVRSQQLLLHTHHLSSSAVDVQLGQQALSRFEKTQLIAGWDAGLACLRVCLTFDVPAPDQLNCGRCEKCVRTMLALLALDRLHAAPFPAADVTPEMLDALETKSIAHVRDYEDVIEPLRARGRTDLADRLRALVADFKRHSPARPRRRWWFSRRR